MLGYRSGRLLNRSNAPLALQARFRGGIDDMSDDQKAALQWILDLEDSYPGELEFELLPTGDNKLVDQDVRSILRRGGRSTWFTSTRGPMPDDRRKFIDNLDAHAKEVCRKADGKFSARYGIVHERLEHARTLLDDLEGRNASGRGSGRGRGKASSGSRAREEPPKTVSLRSYFIAQTSDFPSKGARKARTRRRACEGGGRSTLQEEQVY